MVSEETISENSGSRMRKEKNKPLQLSLRARGQPSRACLASNLHQKKKLNTRFLRHTQDLSPSTELTAEPPQARTKRSMFLLFARRRPMMLKGKQKKLRSKFGPGIASERGKIVTGRGNARY